MSPDRDHLTKAWRDEVQRIGRQHALALADKLEREFPALPAQVLADYRAKIDEVFPE